MSDRELRVLERQWRESGSEEDEVRYLQERVRLGDLPAARLELAAYLGHDAARRCLQREVASPTGAGAVVELPDLGEGQEAQQSYEELASWVLGLERWGNALVVVASLAACQSALTVWEKHFPEDRRPHSLVEALAAELQGRELGSSLIPARISREIMEGADAAMSPMRTFIRGVQAVQGADKAADVVMAAKVIAKVLRLPEHVPSVLFLHEAARPVGLLARATSVDAVRTAVREALVPWSLGLTQSWVGST